jgi:hypothetical protein
MDTFVNMLTKLNFGMAMSRAKALVSFSALRFPQSVLSLWEWVLPSRQPLPKTSRERIIEWNKESVILSKLYFCFIATAIVLAFLHYTYLLWSIYGSAVARQMNICTST